MARATLVVGTAAVVLGLSKAHAVHHGYDFTSSDRFAWSFAYIALLVLAAYGVGLPDMTRTRRSAVVCTLASTLAASVGMAVVQLLAGSALLPRFVLFAAPAALLPLYVLTAVIATDGRTRQAEKDRLVVVAGPDEAAELGDELASSSERPAALVAVLNPEAAVSTGPQQQPLVEAARAHRATAVVLDRRAQNDDTIVAQAALLHESGVRVRTLSLCYDQWLGKLPISELERVSLMFDIGELHRARYGRVKRILDVVAGATGLAVLVLAVPVVAVANRFGNRGPLFYRQPRVGKNGAVFEILKFRTMAPASPEAETHWTSDGDRRLTPFGAWMRRAHLDELPQAVNILRGDLSLVGPRPEQPHYVERLTEKIPFYNLRHLVRPGLTGWAQVKYPYGASEADALEKLQYEFYYLRHQGLALDARIVARTLRSVFGRGGR